MKFGDFLAFLLTLIAIIIVIYGFTIRFSGGFVSKKSCEGYSVFLFLDEEKIDTEMGKGRLTRLRVIRFLMPFFQIIFCKLARSLIRMLLCDMRHLLSRLGIPMLDLLSCFMKKFWRAVKSICSPRGRGSKWLLK